MSRKLKNIVVFIKLFISFVLQRKFHFTMKTMCRIKSIITKLLNNFVCVHCAVVIEYTGYILFCCHLFICLLFIKRKISFTIKFVILTWEDLTSLKKFFNLRNSIYRTISL